MKSTTLQPRIPQLRFKEFDGEWQNEEFGKLVVRSKAKYNPVKDVESLPCIELECLSQETGELLKTFDSLEQKSIKNRFDKGDILFGKLRPYLRKFLKAPFKGVCSSEIWVLRGSELENEYLYQLIQTHKFNLEINITSGSKMPRAEWEYISNVKFKFPSLKEQQKIATFLTAVDDKISQLTSKKEQLTQYKKGVMQQLFSQELRFQPDASQPSLRGSHCEEERRGKLTPSTSNDNQFPDWEEKRLGEVCEIVGGGTPDTNVAEYWDGEIQWFTPTEINKRLVYKSKRTITTLGLKKSSARLLPKGTILFTSRATIGELSFATEDCTTNQGFQSVLVNSNNNSEYFYYWMKKNKKEFIRKSQGSTFLEISKNEMKKIKLKLPSLKEQQKIASYLSALDDKIEAVQVQIEKTQEFKKGLLQQLFV